VIWYLKHSGWALKTKSALLVFDYWTRRPADKKLLANRPHRPGPSWRPQRSMFFRATTTATFRPPGHRLEERLPGIQYIFGFESDVKTADRHAPRTERKIGDSR